MHSTYNEGKSVLAKKVIAALTNQIYKYMISISKTVYIDKLDEKANKYNYAYHRTTKMKPVDVKPSTYINSSEEFIENDLKSEIGDIVRISNYRNFFCKKQCLKKYLWFFLKIKYLILLT